MESGQILTGSKKWSCAIGMTGRKESTMIKLKFFVHCSGWADGGYENTLYFTSVAEARHWLSQKPHCEMISIEEVTAKEFAEDYIGEL